MAEGRKTLVLQEVEPVTVEKEEVEVSEEEQVTVPKWRMAARFVVGCGLLVAGYLVSEKDVRNILLAVGYMLFGYDVIVEAYENILKKKITDSSVMISLATIPCFYIERGLDAGIAMALYRITRYISDNYINKIKETVNRATEQGRYPVHWVKDDQVIDIGNDKVRSDMILSVGKNEEIPVDSVLLSDSALVSTENINGVKAPLTLGKEAELASGYVNAGDDPIRIRALKTLEESTSSKIKNIIRDCKMNSSKAEETITKLFRFFTPAVMILAIAMAVLGPHVLYITYEESIFAACCLLAVSYPLGMLLSVPLAFYCGSSAAGRNGVLIKGARCLEQLSDFDYLVLDRTNTIDNDFIQVAEIRTDMDINEFMSIVTAIESQSDHAIARAILHDDRVMKYDESKVRNFAVEDGMGITAKYGRKQYHIGNMNYMRSLKVKNLPEEYDNAIYVCDRENYLGAVLFTDNSKDTAIKDINDLKDLGVNNIALFSSESQEKLNSYIKTLNLTAAFGNMTPKSKEDKIVLFKRQGRTVAMVGDSDHDSELLKAASVGVTMGVRNPEAAFENSDVVLMYDSLEGLVKGRRTAKKTTGIARFNIAINIVIKLILITLAVVRLVPIWVLVLADLIVALLSVVNSARLAR